MQSPQALPTVQQEVMTTLWLIALQARGGPVALTKAQAASIGYLAKWARFDARA